VRLAIPSLGPLIELVEERGGQVSASEAAQRLFALQRTPAGVARSLLRPLVDEDARLEWRGSFVVLAERPTKSLEDADFVVFDLETTGLLAGSAQICEIGAIRIEALEPRDAFETLVSGTIPPPAARLSGLTDEALGGAPGIATALDRFCAFSGQAALVAHNARFDVGFVNRELERLGGGRLATAVIDTLPLARNLLRGRLERMNLSSLACFFGVSAEPCHRALPDAVATAEVFLHLVGLAREKGVSTVAGLEELGAAKNPGTPSPRRARLAGAR